MNIVRYFKSMSVAVLMLASTTAFAAEPDGYYSSCENKNGAALLSALCAKVGPHTAVSYNGLFQVYATSDVKANGKIWDMYSTKEWNVSGPRCGNYSKVGDCYNREHSFPKSWFGDAKPMYTDAYHLYPTDGKVNGQRSNFPYGECANGTTLPSNGGVDALGRLGTSTFTGYSGTVFEPVDEYKGDFARSYFYMAAAYNDKIGGWNSPMLANNSYPAFSSWAINLLLKWHRQDPVSQKEIDRNEAVSEYQKNRNPFIDHPELAEYIWGNKKDQLWSLNITEDPVLSLPVTGSKVDFGIVAVGHDRSREIVVKGSNITEAVSVSVTGGDFKTSVTTLDAAKVNAVDGATLTITCNAQNTGVKNGTLTITAGELKSTVTLVANAIDGLPVAAATNISDESFVANWTYVSDEDAAGNYTLIVLDNAGNNVDGYPKAVNAKKESYLVDNLTPSTTYTYQLKSQALQSDVISVTTADPIPSIEFLYDGTLMLETQPGTPSEAAELLVEVENITTNITISVNAPFELSSDKTNWSKTLVISPEEDRIYVRVNSDTEGTFTSSITAVAGEYTTDDAEVEARVAAVAAFIETFEVAGTGNYNATTYAGVAAEWLLSDAGVFKGEAYEGDYSLRTGKTSSSSLTLDGTRPNGIGKVVFHTAIWPSDADASFDIQTSDDNGLTWTTAATIDLPKASATLAPSAYKEYTVTVNKPGVLGFRIQQTAGKRFAIDNLQLFDYTGGIDGVVSDYRSWDAYCLNHQLVIELADASTVAVYGVDGRTYEQRKFATGTTALDLPAGLYVVVVDDFSRRVLVK